MVLVQGVPEVLRPGRLVVTAPVVGEPGQVQEERHGLGPPVEGLLAAETRGGRAVNVEDVFLTVRTHTVNIKKMF